MQLHGYLHNNLTDISDTQNQNLLIGQKSSIHRIDPL